MKYQSTYSSSKVSIIYLVRGLAKTLLKISLGNKEPMEVGVKTQLYSNS